MEKQKILNTLERILDSEDLTTSDLVRLSQFLRMPVKLASPNPQEVQAAFMQLRQVVNQVYSLQADGAK